MGHANTSSGEGTGEKSGVKLGMRSLLPFYVKFL
jgi:hypothetical protein